MHKKHAFTLVEAVISVSILIVLSAVSFYQFVGSMTDARNASRIADIGNTKTHLKNLKIKNGGYPAPKNSFSITNSGSKIIQQGILPENVSLGNNTIPIDPLTNNNYLYSTLTTNLRFQIGASLEDTQESNQIGWKAYVDGDFEKVSQISDGLLFATSTGGEINTLSGKIILKNSTHNLPYDGKGAVYSAGVSYSNVISAKDIVQEKSNSYFSCNEILKQGYNLGNGEYTITPKKSNTPFNVYCDMTSDGGGWTLVAKALPGDYTNIYSNNAIGVLSYTGTNTAKLSTNVINTLIFQGESKMKFEKTGLKKFIVTYADSDNQLDFETYKSYKISLTDCELGLTSMFYNSHRDFILSSAISRDNQVSNLCPNGCRHDFSAYNPSTNSLGRTDIENWYPTIRRIGGLNNEANSTFTSGYLFVK